MKVKYKDLIIEMIEYFNSGKTNSKHEASKVIAAKHGYHSSETLRKNWAKYEHLANIKKEHSGLANHCEERGIDIGDVAMYWDKTKEYSVSVRLDKDEKSYFEQLTQIIESYNPDTIRVIPKNIVATPKAIKATLSDMHIGLEPNPNNKSLFSYEYNEQIFKDNLDKVFNSLLKEYEHNGTFDLLLIDDLGDGLDGYNGLTTRGGHQLPQNMTNEQSFKTFVEGKLTLIENCIKAGIANQIIIRNVANDNHSGSFASIANMAIQMIINRTYEKSDVEFYILEKFMEHFEYGEHTFILTHGKDSQYMFKGLPFELNDKATTFINDYIEHYNIKSKFIHLEKGDLHRVGYSRTKKFDYRNYMSFAPPSAWVQHNFGDCYSGYSIQIVPKFTGEISHTDYYFDLTKKI
jgi:hypothetical protein